MLHGTALPDDMEWKGYGALQKKIFYRHGYLHCYVFSINGLGMNSSIITVIIAVLCLDDKLFYSCRAPQLLSKLLSVVGVFFSVGG